MAGRCLIAALLLAVSAAQGADPRRHALIIGVPEYESKALPHFLYAGADSYELARALGRAGYTVSLMNEGEGKRVAPAQPTLSNIRAALRAFAAGKGPRDQLLFAFIGHGLTLRVGGRDYQFVCGRDAVVTNPLKMMAMSELFRLLDASKAGTKLLLFDVARPGAAVRGFDPPRVPRLPGGMAALFASTSEQAGWVSAELGLGHGVFAYSVAEGLSCKFRDEGGDLTWAELGDIVSKEVPRLARQIDPLARQTPLRLTNLAGPSPTLVRHRRLPRTLINSIGMQFARIPAGRFLMGAPRDEKGNDGNERRHAVVLTRPYYLGVFEVTQKQYKLLTNADPSAFSATGRLAAQVRGMDTGDFPVDSVSYQDARAYCDILSRLPQERKAGRVYRLPTEAEWEYACRAGSVSAFTFGNTISSHDANMNGHFPHGGRRGPWLKRTTSVGSYKPNRWGLFDMHGNVREWTRDRYERDMPAGPLADPTGPRHGKQRVIRGGCWRFGGDDQRCARRRPAPPANTSENLGFRILLIAP